MEGKLSSNYIAKCHRALSAIGAPLIGWYCTEVFDSEASDAHCELCGCKKVRFIHIMSHAQWADPLKVGCICAGVMEGDILAAKERERLMRNRAMRKRNYLKKTWNVKFNGNRTLRYKGKWITIISRNGVLGVMWEGQMMWEFKAQRITDFFTARLAAFDLVDPPVTTATARSGAANDAIQ